MDTVFIKIEKFLQPWWGMALALAVPVGIVFATLLSGHQVLGSFIGIEQQLQYTYFYQDAILRGDSIFWNPYNFSGFPTFVDLNIGFFSPLIYFVALFLTVPTLYYWATFFTIVLSGLFVAFLLRSFNVSVWGQYIAGLGYIFVTRQQWSDLTVMESFMVLSGILWIVSEIAQKKSRKTMFWTSVLGVLLVAHGWLGGHWHFLLNALFVGGLFAVYLFWTTRLYRVLYSYAAMVLVGTLLGLVKMIPTLVMMSYSARADGFGGEVIHGEGFSFLSLLTLMSPTFTHPLFQADAEWIYVGLLPLFLAVGVATRRFRSPQGFFTYLLVFAALLGLRGLPFFGILQQIPPFTFTHSAVRWIYVIGFAMAVLAGFGIDRIEKGIMIERWQVLARKFSFAFFIFTITSVIGAIFTWFAKKHSKEFLFLGKRYFEQYYYHPASFLSLEQYFAYLEKMFYQALSLFNIGDSQFFFALLFMGASAMVVWLFARGYIFSRHISFVVATVLVLNFIGTHIFFGNRFDRRAYEDIPPTVSYLKNHEDRVFSFLEGNKESEILESIYPNNPPTLPSFQLYSATMVPSRNLKYGVESAGYNATITNLKMARLVGYIGGQVSQKELNQVRDANISLVEKSHLFTQRLPLISFLGIRYITSVYLLDETVFPKVFETTATSHEIPVYIYENKQARPLYYFTKETELLDLPQTTTPQELQKTIESTSKTKFITQEGITLQSRGNAHLELHTNTPKSQLLVFSQNNLPGWRVFIDNERTDLHTFATVYQALRVPQGEHTVRFEYSYGEIWREFFKNIIKLSL